MKWKPIESAPKDGTPILICTAGYDTWKWGFHMHPQTASWRAYHPNAKGKECWRDNNGHKTAGSHWMPLPKSPRKESSQVVSGGKDGNG